MDIKPYKKDCDYSYTLGAFPTFELLNTRPETVSGVLVHSSFTDSEKVREICKNNNIPVEVNDKLINKLSDKENVFCIGILNKFQDTLRKNAPHVVLVNPGNMGNMGTIMRTAVGFGIKNMAVITPGADSFNPKTLRASMGARFRMNVEEFNDFKDYMNKYPEQDIYCFMLNSKRQLTLNECNHKSNYTLVFGNEATGLSDDFMEYGQSILIPQTPEVDSLNITIAAGIGMFVFSR